MPLQPQPLDELRKLMGALTQRQQAHDNVIGNLVHYVQQGNAGMMNQQQGMMGQHPLAPTTGQYSAQVGGRLDQPAFPDHVPAEAAGESGPLTPGLQPKRTPVSSAVSSESAASARCPCRMTLCKCQD